MADGAIKEGTTEQMPAAETKFTEGGSPASTVEQSSSSTNGNTVQAAQCNNQKGSPTHVRRTGGPLTRLGKAGSRSNAAKHGLSAKMILLRGESPAEFKALVKGYRNHWRPVGTPEEDAVEDLAWVAWRLRRLPPAERAEIELEKKYNSRAADREKRDREEAQIIEEAVDSQTLADVETARNTGVDLEIPRPGLIDRWDNPVVRQKCLQLLRSFHKSIKLRAFFPDRDLQIINKIFGVRTPSEFRCFYNFCLKPGEPLTEIDFPIDKRIATFLDYLDNVIANHENRAKRIDSDSARRVRLESESAVIPERLLRYRTSLEREYDRILNRLIRLQQIRKGQPMPTLNINLAK